MSQGLAMESSKEVNTPLNILHTSISLSLPALDLVSRGLLRAQQERRSWFSGWEARSDSPLELETAEVTQLPWVWTVVCQPEILTEAQGSVTHEHCYLSLQGVVKQNGMNLDSVLNNGTCRGIKLWAFLAHRYLLNTGGV